VYKTAKLEAARKKINAKKGKFWGVSRKQRALELMWHRAADCPEAAETHDRRQWKAVYVGSP